MNRKTDPRSKSTTTISFLLPKALLSKIDAKAKILDITRSQYFRNLAKKDLEELPKWAPTLKQAV